MSQYQTTDAVQTILIVDDNPINLRVLSDHLQQRGFMVVVAQDGEEGLTRARLVQPDLILLDILMPGMDGLETCRRLKACDATREIPVIFKTSLTDTASKIAGFEAGGVDYVTSPIQIEEVMARVQTHLTLHTVQRRLAEQNVHLQQEVAVRQRTEAALEQARAELEERVQQRTAELRAEVAERRRAEAALRVSEQRYRALFHDNPSMYFTLGADGTVLAVNQFGSSQLGYTVDELEGRSILDIVYGEDRAAFRKEVEKCLETPRQLFGYQLRNVRKDGGLVWVEEFGQAVEDVEGKPKLLLVCHDITARKQAEEERSRLYRELQQREAQIRRLVDANIVGIFIWDLEGQILEANDAFLRIVGYEREDLVSGRMRWTDLTPPEWLDRDAQRWVPELKGTGSVQPYEKEYFRKDGSRVPVLIGAASFEEAGNQGVAFVLDVTERKRLEKQLREAQKMEAMGRLAGGIAHDFNNVLTIITGYSKLLHAALEDDPLLQEKADEIYKAGEHATSLTRQLLAFSRHQVVQPKVLDLNNVLGQMATMLRRLLSEDIELKILPDSGPCPILCDPGQIQQVVMNLALNACDAMPEGGTLLLSTENVTIDKARALTGIRAGAYVRLSVSDTGLGMDSETKAHIFEPFFTTKQVGKGTGLGLATVHGIVQQAGGSVTAESEVGKGTTFHLFFPRAKQPVEVSTLLRDEPPAALLHGSELILLVEDQEGLRKLLAEILERHGYRVLAASDGREALRILQARDENIDLMLTDLVMPQMGGRELVEQLPVRHSETKVLFMSGYADKSWQSDKLRVRHAFIDKPFPPEAVLRKIREILDQEAETRRSA